ncbi:HD-GYP domain-containing protein [Ornithinibacillus bavariensis]|uniref:Phosphodiesterase n=1 Tax=Ornithinibacillus bavariensis TaxID=545502 RepID=A0A919XD17_9BACI|nr:HD-GYP domain-containing protein [Ornithinibacillus bavariensis]GIO28642.1 phosphodiesterase [Ornithinibacillus bavariensis]
MRLVATASIQPGEVLGQTIYRDNGTILLHSGVQFTARLVKRLLEQGITYVYIEDEATKDIVVQSVLSDRLRQDATSSMRSLFADVQKNKLNKNSFVLDEGEKNLTEIIHRIAEEISSHDESISLLTDIYLTDDYIFQHSLNVTIYALAIGATLNLNAQELAELGKGAILHDIGKVFIDPEILQKPDKLTDEEYEIMKSHTIFGYDVLRKNHNYSSVVAHCAYQHHERLDGTGYPRGLKGSDIHLFAQIIGVADVFDAVTSNRVYRKAMLPHEGVELLYSSAVEQFDIRVVEAFKSSVAVYPNGISVELSDNRQGVVMKQNKTICDRPIIRILKENDKDVEPYTVDLSKSLNVTITKCNLVK